MASGTLVDRYTGVDRYAVCDSTCVSTGTTTARYLPSTRGSAARLTYQI